MHHLIHQTKVYYGYVLLLKQTHHVDSRLFFLLLRHKIQDQLQVIDVKFQQRLNPFMKYQICEDD